MRNIIGKIRIIITRGIYLIMTLPTKTPALDVAAQCFLNSLVRETKDWRQTEYQPAELIIPLGEQQALHFRVAYFSPTQHHRFEFPARLVTASGSQPVDFTTFSRLIIDKLQHQFLLPATRCETFHQRVMESHAHTQQAIDARHDWVALREKALDFGEAEQALLVGHAFHPAPKSHEPFNQQEAERYLPDFAPHFPLRWFAVDKTQIAGESLHLSLQQRLTRFAVENDRLGTTARQAAHAWVDAYCQQVLKPLFTAEADYGLVLLAHQQNILVQMLGDLPVGLIYRDCQGSAFMPHAADWLDTIGEAQAENIFTHEQLLRYFPYYLLVNSTFAVTAALAAAGLDSEANLMARIRTFLAEIREQVTHKTCLNYVLESPYWNVKGNFFCYLNDYNENTILDPSMIYFDFANPLLAQEG